jgi:tol-pal system protein YbgF
MRKGQGLAVVALSVAMLSSGCATAGGSTGGGSSQLQNTVYQTHRMVQNLEENLTGSVSNLTQTTAEIAARIDSSDQEIRRLVSIAEENQRKLDGLQFTLDQLTATLYQQLNLSPPTRPNIPAQPDSDVGGIPRQPSVEVRPPGTSPQITPPLGNPPEIASPDDLFDTTSTPSNDPESHYLAAQQFYTDAEYSKALNQFDEHIARMPQSPYIGNAHYWRAQCYLRMGQYPEAIQGFDLFRSQYGSSGKIPLAMHNQAVTYSRMGQKEKAKALFQQMIREYPDDAATDGARKSLRQLQGLSE